MARQPNAQTSRVRNALRKFRPEIRKAFERAIQQAAGSVDQAALVDFLETGQIERAVDLLRINRAIMFPLDEAIRATYIAGGTMVAADIPRGLAGRFAFDGRHIRAEAWVREHVGNLIQGIEQEGIETTRRVIREGLEAGRSSRVVAREITGKKVGNRRVGGYLGLNSDQTDQVLRARSILSDPEQIREYFVKDRKTGRMKPRYKLSDRRFDKRIKKAIAEGRALSGKDLDDVIEAHRSKALGYRGRLIAKDQSHTALASGREEAYQQMIEDPEVETVTVRWQKSPRINDRPDHQAMDGTVITLGETFDFADAQMKHPHDPAGGPKHNAHCGCIAVYRTRLRRDETAPINPRDRLAELAKDGKEHMVVLDKGKPLFEHTSGDARFISIPGDKFRILADPNRALTVMHNHPIDNVSFSPADLLFFKAARGVSEFTAETTSATFKIRRTSKTDKISEKVVTRLSKEYDQKVAPDFMSGKKTIYDIENERPHAIATELHRLKYLKYSVERVKK